MQATHIIYPVKLNFLWEPTILQMKMNRVWYKVRHDDRTPLFPFLCIVVVVAATSAFLFLRVKWCVKRFHHFTFRRSLIEVVDGPKYGTERSKEERHTEHVCGGRLKNRERENESL